jgi:CRISPR-associated protein Cmr4
MSEALLVSLLAETQIHVGTGQSTGVIDLPVQREAHTGFPTLPVSGTKGSLRELATRRWKDDRMVKAIFGPEAQDGDLHAGAFAPTDARLLAFPVRSLTDVFAWVTCPLVLSRLARDLHLAGMDGFALPDAPLSGAATLAYDDHPADLPLVLEDLSFDAGHDSRWAELTGKIAESFLPKGDPHKFVREHVKKKLVLVSDEDFGYLVEHATQVSARVSLNERKTTTGDGGNLWYEETVPADALFYLLVLADEPRTPANGGVPDLERAEDVRKQLEELLDGHVRLGGNETVGQGWCSVRCVDASPLAKVGTDA